MRQYGDVIVFIVMVLGLTWLLHGTLALLSRVEGFSVQSFPGMALLIAGGSIPTVLAFVFIHRRSDVAHKTFFYQSLRRFRLSIAQIAYALAVPVLLGLLALFVRRAVYNTPWVVFDLKPFYLFPLFLINGVIFGGLEEVGWRGYLQHRLLAWRAIPLAIGIGFVWAIWHIPLFFVVGLNHIDYAFIPYLLQAFVLSVFLTGLYLKTGSLVLTILFHAAINAAATLGLAPVFAHTVATYIYLALAAVVGLYSLHIIEKSVRLHFMD